VRNVSTLGTGQLFMWLCTAGLTTILPQHLGDEGLGKLSLASSLTETCGLIASLGITSYLVKEVARDGTAARTVVLNALVMRAPLTAVAVGFAVIAAALLQYDALVTRLVYLFSIYVALSAVGSVLSGALNGMQEMRPVAVGGVLSKGAMLLLTLMLLAAGYGLEGVVIAWDLAAAVMIGWYLIALARRGGIGGRIDLGLWRPILVGSLPFLVWQAALMVYGQVDVLMLGQLTRDAVVGWYGAAYRLISIPVFVPSIVAAAVFPALSRTASTDRTELGVLARRSLDVVLLLTVPMALGTMMIAAPLLDFLRYPEVFRNAIPLIVILALHIPLVGADMIIGSVLIARDRQRGWAMTAVAAAVLNPSLNLLLIPYFDRAVDNGAIGAAMTTVLTETFMMLMGLAILRGEVFNRSSLRFALRCVVAGLAMTVAVWLVLNAPLPVTIIVGAIVYAAASAALGTITLRDARLLHDYVRRRSRT
jgi:O-antigen/teichoic acid export membrane protein